MIDSDYKYFNCFYIYRQDVGGTGAGTGIGGGGQSRLQLGMFTIFPAFGIILPNGHATVTVDCAPEATGKCEEVTVYAQHLALNTESLLGGS